MQHIGVGHASRTVDLGAIVHAAELGPAFLGQGDHAIVELEDDDRVVVAARPGGVHAGVHLRVHALHGVVGIQTNGRTGWRGSPCPW